MSEEKQMQLAKLIDKPTELKRSKAWSGFGVQMYHTELALQLTAQEIINKLIDPTTPELIKQAEEAAAVVKKEYEALQRQRINVTEKFDPVITRLSSHEKSVMASLRINQEAILKAKQQLKESEKTKEAKAKELAQIAEHVRVYVADMHASYLAAQLNLLSTAYKHALTNNIQPGEPLEEFKAKLCARINLKNTVTPPPVLYFKYNTQADVEAEVAKHFNPWLPQQYVDGFAADVELKFSDWEQALQDKAAALDLDNKEVATTTDAIKQQKEKETVSAHLESISVPITEDAGIKPLKEQWKIAEPETVDEAFAIINAFAVNRDLVQPQMSKMKYINFGIKQMMAALVAVKNDDENFDCTGIIFYKIDKL